MAVVTIYGIDRCYGGPEEGGWWYDWYHPTSTSTRVATGARKGSRKRRRQERRLANAVANLRQQADEMSCPRGRYSVIGGTDFTVCIEDYHGQASEDQESPYYC
jgi:hypothetical protein